MRPLPGEVQLAVAMMALRARFERKKLKTGEVLEDIYPGLPKDKHRCFNAARALKKIAHRMHKGSDEWEMNDDAFSKAVKLMPLAVHSLSRTKKLHKSLSNEDEICLCLADFLTHPSYLETSMFCCYHEDPNLFARLIANA